MVAMAKETALVCCFIFGPLSVTSATFVQNLISDIDPCEDVCQKTYPLHTYEKSVSRSSCSRGCRLYSILELVREYKASNHTLHACYEDCKLAYPNKEEETSACILGCASQKPFAVRWGQVGLDSSVLDGGLLFMLSPFLSVRGLFSGMFQLVQPGVSLSWSVSVLDGTERLVLIRSQPKLAPRDVHLVKGYPASRGQSSVREMKVRPSENTATEVFRQSQIRSANNAMDYASLWRQKTDSENSSDWLACIAKKIGVSRISFSVTVLFSAAAMISLCVSTALTRSERIVSQQKLSINTDLGYLHSLPDKAVKAILPQDFVDVPLLPEKFIVEKL